MQTCDGVDKPVTGKIFHPDDFSVTQTNVNALPDFAAPTVLVVEDEIGLRFLISVVLRDEAGLNVIEAQNADEALKVLQSDIAVDLMFTDVRMPGSMDGIKLTTFAQQHYPRLKVVMASGNITQKEQVPGVKLFPKPYDIDEVRLYITAKIEEDGLS